MDPQPRVRVVIVDDNDDMRLLLRASLEQHQKFSVVGEAANGHAALELAAVVRPDLVILDRNMPGLDGLQALPLLRHLLPDATIVMFTSHADAGLRRAAMAAGADQVHEKLGQPIAGLVSALAGARLAGPPGASGTPQRSAMVHLEVGPVDGHAARVWIANATELMQGVRTHLDVLDLELGVEVLDQFDSFLADWGAVAAGAEEFGWAAAADPDVVETLVVAWGELNRLTPDQLQRIGCHWSPPEGEPFFAALASGVSAALETDPQLARGLEALSWPPSQ